MSTEINLNWNCRSSVVGKSANHVVKITEVPCEENANLIQLIGAQVRIVMASKFEKQAPVNTNETFTFTTWAATYMVKGGGAKALADENARLKAQIAEYEKMMKTEK